jgi:predicted transcriptional regulator
MKARPLSTLEQEVMNIVWELKACSVRDVLQKVNRSKELAYTTVATVLQRLYKKGLLTRNHKNFIIYYTPKLSKKDYGKNLVQSFINKFFSSFGNEAISSFAESIERLPKDKKIYLLKLLEKYDKNK